MLVIRFSKDEKLIILLGLIVGLVLLGGCGEEATKPDNISKPEKTGSLKLSISLPKEKLITKTEEVTVTKMQVKVINQQMQKIIRTESKSVTDDQVKFTVNKLTPDVKYKVKAVAKDSKGNPVYQGSSLRKLEDKAVAEVNISLQLTTAEQVVFQMKNLPEQAAAGIVRLVRPESGKVDQEVRLDLANQKAALENILATTYNVEIDLFKSKDQTESITGFPLEITKLLIYPGRNTVTAPIDLAGEYNDADGDGKGEIKVDVSWPQRPDVPTKVQANTVEEGVHLTWESQAEGYIVLRSKNQAPQTAKPLMETIITNNNYQDLEVTAGTTYYYWIQAYSKNKLASQLSEPQKVTITEISKYTFAATEKKEVDLGVINQGQSAYVGISALNYDLDVIDNYSPTLEVTMAGQTATQTLNVKPFYNQIGSLSADCNQAQIRIDKKMRQQEQEIAAEIKSLQAVGAEQNYTVGDTEDFYLTNYETPVITAVLEAKGDKSMIFVEEGVDVKKEADLNEIKNEFDNNIFATNMKYFGRPPNENYNEIYDIDKNDKLIILITDVSNYFNLSGTVLGFFHPKDMKDSEYSNQADMIYLNSQALNSNQYDLETMLGTLAHEFQHLLFFVEKKNAGREEEDTWINEGFAVMASFLNGYYSYQEDSRIYNSDYGYFAEPYSESLLNWNNYLSDYGASSLFARYIYEEFGNRIFRDVMTSQDRPREVLAEQRKFDQLFLDWGLTNLISNSIAKDRYSYSVKLTSQPAKTTINQAGKVDFTVGSTAWKYFKIKGNGEEVSLKLTGLDQKTGVVVCK